MGHRDSLHLPPPRSRGPRPPPQSSRQELPTGLPGRAALPAPQTCAEPVSPPGVCFALPVSWEALKGTTVSLQRNQSWLDTRQLCRCGLHTAQASPCPSPDGDGSQTCLDRRLGPGDSGQVQHGVTMPSPQPWSQGARGERALAQALRGNRAHHSWLLSGDPAAPHCAPGPTCGQMAPGPFFQDTFHWMLWPRCDPSYSGG